MPAFSILVLNNKKIRILQAKLGQIAKFQIDLIDFPKIQFSGFLNFRSMELGQMSI